MTTATLDRPALLRRGLLLEYLTVGSNIAEGLIGVTDGARTWTAAAYPGSAFAIATTGDGSIVAVVSRETEFFRSSDGGATWPDA